MVIIEAIIPLVMLLPASFTSSATVVAFKSPPKETNIREVVPTILYIPEFLNIGKISFIFPSSKEDINGVYLETSTEL